MTYYAYITLSGDNKLLRFSMDAESGALQLLETIDLDGGPAPLAVDPSQQYLYAGLRSSNEIVTFQIDSATGGLTHMATVSLDANPCYLSTDNTGKFLLAAYYGAGKATVHAINDDGTANGETIQTTPTAEHAHWIQTDRSNSFAFVPHTVPPNKIHQFKFDASSGHLIANDPPTISGDAGEGPRHLDFHPTLDIVYASNENGSSITAYRLDPSSGTLTPFQTLSTLPSGFAGDNTCAQIHIHPTGRSIYVTNRGHDSIACFSLDAETGKMRSLGQQPTEPVPRVFNLDPTGKFLFAAGQGSGRLASYRVDQQSGALWPLAWYQLGKQPMWVMILGF